MQGKQTEKDIHAFRKHFEELEVGETVITHKHTVTESDIANFANVSGDNFYAHMDVTSLEGTIFEERRQRKLRTSLLAELEARVEERTRELASSKLRAETYLENIEVILVVLDQNGFVQLLNRKGCQTFGVQPADINQRNWFDICRAGGNQRSSPTGSL